VNAAQAASAQVRTKPHNESLNRVLAVQDWCKIFPPDLGELAALLPKLDEAGQAPVLTTARALSRKGGPP
jgi:hypothetical protein